MCFLPMFVPEMFIPELFTSELLYKCSPLNPYVFVCAYICLTVKYVQFCIIYVTHEHVLLSVNKVLQYLPVLMLNYRQVNKGIPNFRK